MWIVRLALDRPYTFVVAALLILVLGVITIRRMAVDIFPEIDIPVVSVIWTYTGMSAQEMEQRIVTVSERAFTTTVNNIEHIESRSLTGVSVIKVFFQPGADIGAAVAQLTSVSGSVTRVLPPGITPPNIIRYSASDVPILEAVLSSDSLSEQQLNDYASNFIRTGLATVRGVSVPLPYGGKPRQVRVDLDPQAMYAKGISAVDVSNAVSAQNLILPSGTTKIGTREYAIKLNSSLELIDALNDLPIKQVNGVTVNIRDVAQVHDGYQVQTNVVRKDGRRSTYLTILKSGGASTLDVVQRVKEALPRIVSGLPKSLNVSLLFDQSVFVKASVSGVVREAVIAASLTALMILLFLGSWRSTIMVVSSIPLSILASIIILNLFGYTLNTLTLGGLALAVGILVDDATVTIENVQRYLNEEKQTTASAILNGVSQIATPALVSSLCICIVFLPVFFLPGVSGFLFSPLAMAVIGAILASYLLSRTFLPTLMQYWLPREADANGQAATVEAQEATPQMPNSLPPDASALPKGNWFWRVHLAFDKQFERFRNGYRALLSRALAQRKWVLIGFGTFMVSSLALLPFLGQDFFPTVDAGEFRLHINAPAGSRIEETELLFQQIEDTIRATIPPAELELILDNIGLPYNGITLALSDNVSIGPMDGEILVALKADHKPTSLYTQLIRQKLKAHFPGIHFFYQPADISTQTLNFGLPAPIDIQVIGNNRADNYEIVKAIERRVQTVPGVVDVTLGQVLNVPQFNINVDRTRAGQLGITQRDVAQNVLISLSSSSQTSPNYWLNPVSGISYTVGVQIPPYRIATLSDLQRTPLSTAATSAMDSRGSTTGQISRNAQLLANLATISRSTTPGIVSHYDVQPVFDIYASVENRDLGGVTDDINSIMDEFRPRLPKSTQLVIRGQVQGMQQAFSGLEAGLAFAVLLVYLLMVVNFQSWLDPFIIITALPGALAGILWMLFVTQTTLSVPSLMGAIMGMGVATSNSILLVTFANEQRLAGKSAAEAALAAGFTRIRPVLMTGLAMIIGMLPMALGYGEGGEQNAPLGRAVIGGLLVATVTTLLFVPLMYSMLFQKASQPVQKV